MCFTIAAQKRKNYFSHPVYYLIDKWLMFLDTIGLWLMTEMTFWVQIKLQFAKWYENSKLWRFMVLQRCCLIKIFLILVWQVCGTDNQKIHHKYNNTNDVHRQITNYHPMVSSSGSRSSPDSSLTSSRSSSAGAKKEFETKYFRFAN